jgi:hypothetical protein
MDIFFSGPPPQTRKEIEAAVGAVLADRDGGGASFVP